MKKRLICGCLVAAGAAFAVCDRPSGEKQEFRLGSICVAGRDAATLDLGPSVRDAWFREARFGMFIHWGIYSIPAKNGMWKISWAGNPDLRVKDFWKPGFDDSQWFEIDGLGLRRGGTRLRGRAATLFGCRVHESAAELDGDGDESRPEERFVRDRRLGCA